MSKFSLFLRRHRKAEIIILILVLVLAGVAGAIALQRKAAASKLRTETNVTVLAQKELDQIISSKGYVQSTDKQTVYTQMAAKVSEIAVKVGDTVAVGDLLAKLDTRDLEKTISELKTSIKTVGTQQSTQISQARRKITNAGDQKTIDTRDRQKSVDDAAKAMADARYDADIAAQNAANAAVDGHVSADDAVVYANTVKASAFAAMNAKQAVVAGLQAQLYTVEAQIAATTDPTALITLNTEKSNLITSRDAAQAELELLKIAYANASANYDTVFAQHRQDNWGDQWNRTYFDTYAKFDSAIEASQKAYDQAVLALNASIRADDLTIQEYNNALTNQQLNDNTVSLQNQLKTAELNLADSTITSPFAGTVTEVLAVLGSRPNGALFVIQDTKGLELTTTVAEYDIPQVHQGLHVRFTTEATGSDELSGTVDRISPTAINTDGDFEVIVRIDKPDDRLRIGMNAKLTIVIDSRPSVYSVPYDAITTGATGETVVIGLREDGKTRYEIPVSVGMETDYFVEISGPAIQDGLTILNDPEGKNVVTSSGPTSPFGS
jgi:HlyD family secretion protein